MTVDRSRRGPRVVVAPVGSPAEPAPCASRAVRLRRLRQRLSRQGADQWMRENGCPPVTSLLQGVSPARAEELLARCLEAGEIADGRAPVSLRCYFGRMGRRAPAAAGLDCHALRKALWRVIAWLAGEGIIMTHTDHMSDVELYRLLVDDYLHNVDTRILPPWGALVLYEPLAPVTEEKLLCFLRYYADEDSRREIADLYFDGRLEPREVPPFDRDRFLPRREPECGSS